MIGEDSVEVKGDVEKCVQKNKCETESVEVHNDDEGIPQLNDATLNLEIKQCVNDEVKSEAVIEEEIEEFMRSFIFENDGDQVMSLDDVD